MVDEPEPEEKGVPEKGGPRHWRPCRKEWIKLLRISSLLTLGGLLPFFLRPNAAEVGFVVGTLIIGLGVPILLIVGERRGRPPVQRFWTDGSGFPVVVRHKRTGAVLLECEQPSLSGMDLAGADLVEANLTDLKCEGAQLNGARLRGADLRGCALFRANLQQADLSYTRLANAFFEKADLRGADLRGADFLGRGAGQVIWGSDLFRARLKGAFYNARTRWPHGFQPDRHGCILVEEEDALPIPVGMAVLEGKTMPIPVGAAAQETEDAI